MYCTVKKEQCRTCYNEFSNHGKVKSREDSDKVRNECNNMGKKTISRCPRKKIMEFNKMLEISNASDACPRTLKGKKINLYPPVMLKHELDRIQEASKFKTLEERVEDMNRESAAIKLLENESLARKKLLKDIDDARNKAKLEKEKGKTNTDDLGDDEKSKVLDKAYIAKYEQEEEIKLANRVIMNAKCHVVRNAQIYEKHELEKEIAEEGLRSDKKMIEKALTELKQEDLKVCQDQLAKEQYAREIRQQIQNNEQKRLIEAANIQEEVKIMSKVAAALKRDDEMQAMIKKEKRESLRNDLDQVLKSNKFFKKMAFDQEKTAEMQIQAYMKDREDRQRKFALEKQIAKEAAERKNKILYNNQQKILDQREDQSGAQLRYEQESHEREFRKKEKEAAIKKQQMMEDLKQSRYNQLDAMKQRQALQMAHNEDEFKKLIQKLKEDEKKDKDKFCQRLKNRDKYREEIINQMNRKEMDRREMKMRMHNEYLAWQEKEAVRSKNIRSIIKDKLQAMKDSNLPDKYIKDVERQVKVSLN